MSVWSPTAEPRGKAQKDLRYGSGYLLSSATAHRVIGKPQIDLKTDPPPDVVVEVDKSHQSLSKFPIYATFGVPEIWRFDVRHRRVRLYERRNESYIETDASRAFPILTGGVLVRFLDQNQTEGQMAALISFRQWVRTEVFSRE